MNPEDEVISKLILDGALEISSVDKNSGEFLYSFTPKLKTVMPELYEEHLNKVNSEVMKLWEKGFLDMDFFAKDPVITLTDKAFNEDDIRFLDQESKISLREIKRVISNKL
jgi:hypothetical protein